MIIGIDFDGTFGADIESFYSIVRVFQNAGHICILVTQRSEEQGDEIKEVIGGLMEVVWSSGMAKQDAVAHAGYSVDIWIDDHPQSVFVARTYVGPV